MEVDLAFASLLLFFFQVLTLLLAEGEVSLGVLNRLCKAWSKVLGLVASIDEAIVKQSQIIDDIRLS